MPRIEFMVGRIEPDGLVVGHNGNIDLPVNFVFDSIEKVRVDGQPPELRTVELGQVATVCLAVQEIHCWRALAQVVPRGHAAGLRLKGTGQPELEQLIENLEVREYVYLRSRDAQPFAAADGFAAR